MEEIRLTSWYDKYSIIYRVNYTSQWLFGISSTQQYGMKMSCQKKKDKLTSHSDDIIAQRVKNTETITFLDVEARRHFKKNEVTPKKNT